MGPFPQPSHVVDGKHAVRFGDGIALLDVAGDSYSCIYDPLGHATAFPLVDTRLVASEVARVPEEDQQSFERWRDLPAADSKVRLRDVLHFVATLSVATIRFRRHDFEGLLSLDKGRSGRGAISSDDLAAILARFEKMVRFLPIPILCLFRSFFLLHFLATYGYAADWVFGVTLFPFRAHCWIASGDLLLGETSKRAMEFSPIHVIKARPS